MINVGDIVSRNKYNNDTYFKVVKIEDDIYYLLGIEVRLCADSPLSDLKKEDIQIEDTSEEEDKILERIYCNIDEERDDFFYIPGKILHIDGDIYLNNNKLKKIVKINCKY